MKVTDLMIGDWVVGNNKQSFQIGVIDPSFRHWDEIEPIPLTPEILEKNGFYKSEIGKRDEIGNYFLERHYAPILFFSISYDDGRDIGNRIEYVHELQHALRLCGIEKEIVL